MNSDQPLATRRTGPSAFQGDLRHPADTPLFTACLVISLVVYLAIAVAIVRVAMVAPPVLVSLAAAGLVVWIVSIAARAILVTHVRGNGLRVGPDQLPHIHTAVQQAADALGCRVPEVYVVQFGGLRESIVKIFLGARILVLSSSLLEDFDRDSDLLAAVARRVALFRFGRIRWVFWLFPSAPLPFLYPAWRRAREYTADRCALAVCADPATAERALHIDAAGGYLGRKVSAESYRAQVAGTGGFWMTLLHLLSTTPGIAWRAGQLHRAIHGPQAPRGPRRSVLATILCAFVPGAAAEAGPFGAAGALLVPVAIIALLVAVLVPGLTHARRWEEASTLSDLRAACLGVVMYADEHRDMPPASMGQIEPYVGPDTMAALRKRGIHYVMEGLPGLDPMAGGRRLRLRLLPPETVLFWCGRKEYVLVGFCDSRVHKVSKADFESILQRTVRQLTGD